MHSQQLQKTPENFRSIFVLSGKKFVQKHQGWKNVEMAVDCRIESDITQVPLFPLICLSVLSDEMSRLLLCSALLSGFLCSQSLFCIMSCRQYLYMHECIIYIVILFTEPILLMWTIIGNLEIIAGHHPLFHRGI